MQIDFDLLSDKIDQAVISLVSIFNKKKVSNISQAKKTIKNVFAQNNSNYVDYSTYSFDMIETLLAYRKSNDFESFYQRFLFATFLLIPVLKINENDELLKNNISDVIILLYEQFQI